MPVANTVVAPTGQAPRVSAVAPGSAAERAGICVGDEVVAICGEVPRDIIQYRFLADEADPEVDLRRGGLELTITVEKPAGEPLGAEVESPLFDRIRTCDNHCSFCFIYQLPKGMRPSLYVKDDDYRLSFLYGNFTTLTRFTEADLERVITEGLSPLFVSIHATDPGVRSEMLRNRRGATSLRWLSALLEAGVEVHGQIVVCPGVNDGAVLEATLVDVLDRYSGLSTLACVPLGISRHSSEPGLRSHTPEEAQAVIDVVERWQQTYLSVLGRRLVFVGDEYHLLAGLDARPFPAPDAYEGFTQHENGIGMVAALSSEWRGEVDVPLGPRGGFFQSVDGAPASSGTAYTTPASRAPGAVSLRPSRKAPVAILTGEYGEQVLAPLVAGLDRDDVRIIGVRNDFFGGNIAVAGLLVGEDLQRVLAHEPEGHRYLLPDVCVNEGRFLDGLTPADLPRPVELVPTDGLSLRKALTAG